MKRDLMIGGHNVRLWAAPLVSMMQEKIWKYFGLLNIRIILFYFLFCRVAQIHELKDDSV